jgi:hypothetical protein
MNGFSELFEPISNLYTASSGPVPEVCWINLPSFCIAHTVAESQKPSRSRSFCGDALNKGEEGLPYAFRRLLPHPRIFRVLTPVMGFVPLAYLHKACK